MLYKLIYRYAKKKLLAKQKKKRTIENASGKTKLFSLYSLK